MEELDPLVQPRDLSPYAGRWIACIGDQIIGQGGTPEQALHAAQASRFKEIAQITYVSPTPPLQIHPFLEKLADYFPPDFPVYVVGGAVRNALLRRPVKELDFILPEKAIKHARRIANEFNGDFYALDPDRDYGRVLIPQPEDQALVLDFAPIQGNDLEADLKNRDFTFNAMAVGIQPPFPLYDPLGGATDLHAKRLRTCTPAAFTNDPIRILRGIRFSLEFNVRPDKDTKEYLRAAVDLLANVSAERLRDELFHLFAGPKPSVAIDVLDRLGALEYIFPELDDLHGLKQTVPHIHDAWKHTLDVVNQLHSILEVLSPSFNPESSSNLIMGIISHRLGRYRIQLTAHLEQRLVQTRSLRALIYLAALYHDSGKPECVEVEPDGRIRFINHEVISANLVVKRGEELQLSNLEINRLQIIASHHMRPLLLAQTGKMPSRRAKYRFFRDTGIAGIDICLLSLADTLATYGSTLPPDTWAHQVDVVRSLLEAWWENKEKEISPPPLIDGNDLMQELGLTPGPTIGLMLERIKEAQATGLVNNRRQAYELAKSVLNDTELESET